jgi:hypothetical protein
MSYKWLAFWNTISLNILPESVACCSKYSETPKSGNCMPYMFTAAWQEARRLSLLVLSWFWVGYFCGDYSMNIPKYPLSQKLIFAFAWMAQPHQFTNTNIHHSWIDTCEYSQYSIVVVFSINSPLTELRLRTWASRRRACAHRHGHSCRQDWPHPTYEAAMIKRGPNYSWGLIKSGPQLLGPLFCSLNLL